MKVNLHIVWLSMLGLLTACTGMSPDRYLANKQAFMVNQGNPPAYVEGYVDGCSCGRLQAGDRRFKYCRDSLRFDKDALYAKGWQDGEINCRNDVLREQVEAAQNKDRMALPNDIDEERRRRVEAESRAADQEAHEIWEELKK